LHLVKINTLDSLPLGACIHIGWQQENEFVLNGFLTFDKDPNVWVHCGNI